MVERLGQRALVVVAADDGHVAQARAGLDAQRAQRGDDAAAHGIGQREVGDLGREHVADVLLQQLVGGRHADVGRAAEAPDRLGGALAERRVRLVADDHAVGVGVDVGRVLDEPRVGLDRDGRLAREPLALLDRADQPRAVALLLEIAHELVDEQAAVREDEHADRAAGLDEARGGDGLARRGRVLEAIAAHGARVVDLGLRGDLGLVLGPRRPHPRPRPRPRSRRRRRRPRRLRRRRRRRPRRRRPRRPRRRPRRPRHRPRARRSDGSSPFSSSLVVVGSSASASSSSARAPRPP